MPLRYCRVSALTKHWAARFREVARRDGFFVAPKPRAGVFVKWFSYVYFGSMVVRYVVTMAALMAGGLLLILLNYMGLVPGGDTDNLYLLIGLAGIGAGFAMTLNYR